MTDPISPERFHEIGWRVLREVASVHFATGSFVAGAGLVEAIGKLTDVERGPDVDLRPKGVTVRLWTDGPGPTERELVLAERINEAARELGLRADLAGLEVVQVAIDALVIPDVLPFWRAVLGYDQIDDADLIDPRRENPPFWFQQMDAPRPQRNRIHIDVYVSHDEAEARVAAGLAAGGHIVSDARAPLWWTLADSEGNEVDIAPWPDQG